MLIDAEGAVAVVRLPDQHCATDAVCQYREVVRQVERIGAVITHVAVTDGVGLLIQDLKDFSRVDSELEWQWTDLHKGIDSTLNIVASELKYKADVLRSYGALPEIKCLPSQINQVVMNLVVNAAQAMGEQRGKIEIRTGTQGENVWIEIHDNGSGIAPDVLPKIFDPFFTTKAVGKGTGLGLSLSYGIVRKHGGTMGVESEPGQGTTFRIELPLDASSP